MNDMRNIVVLLTAALAAFFCNAAAAQAPDSVYLITQHDKFDAAAPIDDFSVKNNISWKRLKENLTALAHTRGANIVLIKTMGNATARHVKGSLYHADVMQIQAILAAHAVEDGGCAIVIFRDNGPSLATYKYDVFINGEAFPDFNDMSIIRKTLPACDAVAEVQVARFRQSIPLKGRSHYFRLIKNTQVGVVGPMVFYNFGGAYSFLEIDDEEQARAICAPLKQYMP